MPEYEVVVARYGTRSTRRSEVYLNHALYGEGDGPIGMDYYVWAIRDGRRTIVVDTGFSRAGGDRRGRTMITEPPQLFASLGIRAEDAPTVVITHGHYDHIGNVAHFDRSEIVIAQAELDFWSGPLAHRRQFHHSVDDDELAVLFAAQREGRVRAFSESLQLAPGIEIIRIGGHTPGQCVITVPTSAGTLLLASDAVHYDEELAADMPFSSVAELTRMYEGFDRIHAMLAAGEIQHVVPGHDPAAIDRLAPLGERVSENVLILGSIPEGTP